MICDEFRTCPFLQNLARFFKFPDLFFLIKRRADRRGSFCFGKVCFFCRILVSFVAHKKNGCAFLVNHNCLNHSNHRIPPRIVLWFFFVNLLFRRPGGSLRHCREHTIFSFCESGRILLLPYRVCSLSTARQVALQHCLLLPMKLSCVFSLNLVQSLSDVSRK